MLTRLGWSTWDSCSLKFSNMREVLCTHFSSDGPTARSLWAFALTPNNGGQCTTYTDIVRAAQSLLPYDLHAPWCKQGHPENSQRHGGEYVCVKSFTAAWQPLREWRKWEKKAIGEEGGVGCEWMAGKWTSGALAKRKIVKMDVCHNVSASCMCIRAVMSVFPP